MATILVLGSFADSLVNFRGELLAALSHKGHRVIGCAPDASADTRKALDRIGVRYQPVTLQRSGMNPLRDVQTLWQLNRLMRRLGVDILLSYTIKPVLYGSLAARLAGVKRSYSMITGIGATHSLLDNTVHPLGWMLRNLYRGSLRGNSAVLFQNSDDWQQFLAWNLLPAGGNINLINGSGVDLVKFGPQPFPKTISFLLLARLLRDKGICEYAEAARIAGKTSPVSDFRLAGWLDAGPNAITSAELNTWKTNGDVDYLGNLTDVRPAIANCSVYVLPSYREGLPRSVLEAMSMGRPIITCDVPGCRETVIDGFNGFLVPSKDSGALAEAMARFVRQPELIPLMGQRSRELAQQKFDVHKVNRSIIETMGL